jgi:hypothetical protein
MSIQDAACGGDCMQDKADIGLGLGLPSDVLCTKVNWPLKLKLMELGIFIDSWFLNDGGKDDDDDVMQAVAMPAIRGTPTLGRIPVLVNGKKFRLGIFIDCWFLGNNVELS